MYKKLMSIFLIIFCIVSKTNAASRGDMYIYCDPRGAYFTKIEMLPPNVIQFETAMVFTGCSIGPDNSGGNLTFAFVSCFFNTQGGHDCKNIKNKQAFDNFYSGSGSSMFPYFRNPIFDVAVINDKKNNKPLGTPIGKVCVSPINNTDDLC